MVSAVLESDGIEPCCSVTFWDLLALSPTRGGAKKLVLKRCMQGLVEYSVQLDPERNFDADAFQRENPSLDLSPNESSNSLCGGEL